MKRAVYAKQLYIGDRFDLGGESVEVVELDHGLVGNSSARSNITVKTDTGDEIELKNVRYSFVFEITRS